MANGNTVLVPTCGSVSECQSAITGAGLRYAGQVSVDSDQPAGTFLGVAPGPGTRVQQGGSVSVQVSNGSAAAPPAPTEGQPAPPADPNAPDTNGDGQPG